MNNYCPISLLPSLSKVLQKLIKFRFVKFFDCHSIFYVHQYGFRKNYLFADDTHLVLSNPAIPSLTQICNNKLHNLKSWWIANYLQVNPSKSVSFIFLFKQNKPIHEMQFFCNEFVIANEDVCQYLGVIIIANLTSRPLLTMPNQESLKALVYLVDCIIYSLHPLYSVIFQFNSTPSLIRTSTLGKHFSLLPHQFAAPPQQPYRYTNYT